MPENAGTPPTVSARFPDLAGKTAIVTGASRGIGVGIAEFLGRQGMRVVITARTREKGEAVASDLEAAGVDCLWITADVATEAGAKEVFDRAVERFTTIDLLVNNAAQLSSKPFPKLDEKAYHDSFERNMRMVYGISFLVTHHMIDRGGGNIIHISSVGGRRAHRGLAGYDASKGAIDSLTRSMALDLAPHGIRVNAVAPGRTPNAPAKPFQGIPLGRTGTPEDMAAAVAFLASDAAAYITGQIIYVDGGLVAQLTPPGIHI